MTEATDSARPLYDDPVIFRRRWFLCGIMCLSLVMVVMSVAGLNVALPSLQTDLNATATELQWIIDAYALVFAALLLPAGALGDRFGRKRALLLGLTIFALGSLVGGIGTNAPQIIAGRIINGIGAAFVMPATLSLITTIFPPNERSKAIALWAGFAGAGGALGPILSGALLENFWWGSAFLVNVPIVAVVVTSVAIFSPTSKDPDATPLDPIGALLSLLGLAGLVFAIIEGPERGWTDGAVIGAFVLAVVCLTGFLLWERRSVHPMLPLTFFEDRRMSAGSAVVTVAFFVMFGLFFLLTLYLQFVRDYSPLAAGLATLPLAVTLVAVAPRSASLALRIGSGLVMAVGFLCIGGGFGILSFLATDTPYLVLVVSLVLLGAGLSLTAAPATACIMNSVPQAKAGVGSAVNDTTREVGGALGIAVLGSISNAVYRSSINIDDLPLPPPVKAAAEESIGAATFIARSLPEGGRELAARAGSAFTHSFSVTSRVALAVTVVSAAVVAWAFSHKSELAAAGVSENAATEPPVHVDLAPEGT